MKQTAIVIALTLIVIGGWASAQSSPDDTTKAGIATDTLQVDSSRAAYVDTALIITRPRFTAVSDSLLKLLFRDRHSNREAFPDRPQSNSNWQSEPALYRNSVTMWGDFESFYAFGLPPSHMSRSDDFVGEQSFANPIPLANSEEFVRSEPSDRYYLLSPGLSGLFAPFGRTSDIHQQSDLVDFDTATSTIYVNRGRGGFANTTFEFKSNFGKLGSIRTDGTFQKTDGLVIGANTNMRRMRILVEPRMNHKWRSNILYSFNRLEGSKVFFPDNYNFDGHVSDYFANLSTSLSYLRSENTQLDLRFSYKNDAQYFDQVDLVTSQRFRLVESAAEYQVRGSRSTFALSGRARYLRFISQDIAANSVSFDLGAHELFAFSPQTTLFGAASITGSSDVSPRPSIVGSAVHDLKDKSSLAATVAWRAILPQPEMLYLQPISAALFDSVADYSITGDDELGAGTARTAELAYIFSHENNHLRLAAGVINLDDVAEWSINTGSLLYGETRPVEVDKSVLYASVQGRAQPFSRVSLMLAYGVRKAKTDGADVTVGPQHTASGSTWYGFPIKRFKLWVNFGVGAAFRSAINRHMYGGVEDGIVIAESYFSFDLKRFHFYFNYHNLLNVDYTMNGVEQPGRSTWWGFRWKFID
ncbi:MAG: TonB-dependent receptor [Candidatus Zixiibacteriota bacterium]